MATTINPNSALAQEFGVSDVETDFTRGYDKTLRENVKDNIKDASEFTTDYAVGELQNQD